MLIIAQVDSAQWKKQRRQWQRASTKRTTPLYGPSLCRRQLPWLNTEPMILVHFPCIYFLQPDSGSRFNFTARKNPSPEERKLQGVTKNGFGQLRAHHGSEDKVSIEPMATEEVQAGSQSL
jgi:hypothetical protein